MPGFNLPEHLQTVRNSLSRAELRLLAQEILDEITPVVYKEGLRDGKAKVLEAQRREREKRPGGRKRGRRQERWITAVYFIRSPSAIKIGMSNNPERRLKVLQTSHPEPLELLAFCEGGQDLEREYHDRFAEYRLKGEWFEPHPAIIAEAERLSTYPIQELPE